MKNVTLSIDEPTYTRARVVAAKRGTSLSRLVRDYLHRIEQEDSGAAAEWHSLWQELDGAQARVGTQPSRQA
ncbi:MAG: DUF6364 family protein, partial [Salinisphaera sp.]|nr:DUF6364 family protein [Salinisphaera sp.]